MNRTRLCTAAHFARNEIKYLKSRERGICYSLRGSRLKGKGKGVLGKGVLVAP